MLTTHNAELFITLITFLISYFVAITGANMFRSWVAYQMGDDSAVQLGFFTINPLQHVDPIGLCCLFLFNFGWGAAVPFYPFNVKDPWRKSKIAVAYFSDTFIQFIFGVIGVVALLLIFDPRIIGAMYYMVMSYSVSYLSIAKIYPAHSTFAVSLGFIIFSFVYLNVVMGVLNFIINISNYIIFLWAHSSSQVAQYGHYITMGLPIVLILFFSGMLRFLAVTLISYMGLLVIHLMGMVV